MPPVTEKTQSVNKRHTPSDEAAPQGQARSDASSSSISITSATPNMSTSQESAIAYCNRHELDGSPYRHSASLLEAAESVDVLVVTAAGGKGIERLFDREVLTAVGSDPARVAVQILRIQLSALSSRLVAVRGIRS